MNKKVKEIIKGITIFTVTLTIGFMVTGISFNLFDELTRNQLRLLFASDIMILLAIGGIAWHITSSAKQKAKRARELKSRHDKRVEKMQKEMTGLNIITSEKFVA